jgi:hypothetical protein
MELKMIVSGAEDDFGYEAPRIEAVLTVDEITREVHYAGRTSDFT